ANNEVKSIIIALGTNIGEMFNIDDLRYHKIVIMTDADVDGAHIRTLLLTLFFRYFPDLINNGHIFIAKPPLYKLTKGKESAYVYSDEEKEAVLNEWRKAYDASDKPAKAKAAKKVAPATQEPAEEGADDE